ncbi:hypothetical protein ACFCP7_10940 [Paenibacillus elgii]
MEKKIAVLSATLILMTGVVDASGLNGDYKGNPIVKVTSNGKPLDAGGVPAMIYDGNTLVSISLLRQLGASVTWDGDVYQVDVKLPKPPATADKSEITKQQNDLNNIGNRLGREKVPFFNHCHIGIRPIDFFSE